jgi:hypothetical protein
MRIQAGVEVKRESKGCEYRPRVLGRVLEAVSLGGNVGQTVLVDRRIDAQIERSAPVVVKSNAVEVLAEDPERVQVSIADLSPVNELNTKLEGRVRGPHEVGYVKAQPLIEVVDGRYRRFADANGADRSSSRPCRRQRLRCPAVVERARPVVS